MCEPQPERTHRALFSRVIGISIMAWIHDFPADKLQAHPQRRLDEIATDDTHARTRQCRSAASNQEHVLTSWGSCAAQENVYPYEVSGSKPPMLKKALQDKIISFTTL